VAAGRVDLELNARGRKPEGSILLTDLLPNLAKGTDEVRRVHVTRHVSLLAASAMAAGRATSTKKLFVKTFGESIFMYFIFENFDFLKLVV
jgi:hypothetical protein